MWEKKLGRGGVINRIFSEYISGCGGVVKQLRLMKRLKAHKALHIKARCIAISTSVGPLNFMT